MTAILAKLRHEPVAFWGGLVTAALAVMGFLGVNGDVIALVGTVATAVGIPIVRSRVTPVPAKATDPAEAGFVTVDAVGLVLAVLIVLIFLKVFGLIH